MEKRYVVLGIGIVALFGQMMAPIPLWLGLPFVVVGLWFIAWGMLGKPFQNRMKLLAPRLSIAMTGFDRILSRFSHEEISEDRHANLEIRFVDGEPYLIESGGHSYCRFSIYNKGPAPAENVRVWLNAINPQPSLPAGYYPPHYPSPVKMITRIDAIELQINRNEEDRKSVV